MTFILTAIVGSIVSLIIVIIIVERGEFDVFNCEFNRCKLTPKGNAVAILKIAKLLSPKIP